MNYPILLERDPKEKACSWSYAQNVLFGQDVFMREYGDGSVCIPFLGYKVYWII